jgi:hypothetical protein
VAEVQEVQEVQLTEITWVKAKFGTYKRRLIKLGISV